MRGRSSGSRRFWRKRRTTSKKRKRRRGQHMALPSPNVAAASQAAAQTRPAAAEAPKQGASKFDSMLNQQNDAQLAQSAQADAAKAANQTQAAQQVNQGEVVEQARKSERVFLHKNGSGRQSFDGVARG